MANTSKTRTTICIKRDDYTRLRRLASKSHRKVSNQITYILDTWDSLIVDEPRIAGSPTRPEDKTMDMIAAGFQDGYGK